MQLIAADSRYIDHTREIWRRHLPYGGIIREVAEFLSPRDVVLSFLLAVCHELDTAKKERDLFPVEAVDYVEAAGMLGSFGNIRVVSDTTLWMWLATLSSMQATRKAC